MLADGLSFNPDGTNKYHIIAVNPPYISEKDYQLLHPQVRDYEPKQALFAGTSGIEFYQKFIPNAPKMNARMVIPCGLGRCGTIEQAR